MFVFRLKREERVREVVHACERNILFGRKRLFGIILRSATDRGRFSCDSKEARNDRILFIVVNIVFNHRCFMFQKNVS